MVRFGPLVLAALAAPPVTWIVFMLGTLTSLTLQHAPDLLPVIGMVLLTTVFGGLLATLWGLGGSLLALGLALFVAESLSPPSRTTRRRPLVLICCALAGLSFAAAGWLLRGVGQGEVAFNVAIVLGFWPWTVIYDAKPDLLMLLFATGAPVAGGLVAGSIYEAMTEPPPEGLTSPAPTAI